MRKNREKEKLASHTLITCRVTRESRFAYSTRIKLKIQLCCVNPNRSYTPCRYYYESHNLNMRCEIELYA